LPSRGLMLSVFTIPRQHRPRIQQHLINRALPEISEWLRKRDGLQQHGEESLTFFFDEEQDEFAPELRTHVEPRRQ
jgi:hypothetical protein